MILNYLAHFYLAAPHEDLMFGNFTGDAVKGAYADRFKPSIAQGITFHRLIDSYTDQHPEVSALKVLLRPNQGKFSGVVGDVLFDHFLAIEWASYSEVLLDDFAQNCYAVVEARKALLPVKAERFYTYMVRNNILSAYATKAGIADVFKGMDHRTAYRSNMLESMEVLDEKFEELQGHFTRFFPDLKAHTQAWIKEHLSS